MTITGRLTTKPEHLQEDTEPQSTKRVSGRILVINEEGWGFITSKAIPFHRIFFHWTMLDQRTLNFKDIEEGMIVEFKPLHIPEKGWRAIQIVVKDQLNEEYNVS